MPICVWFTYPTRDRATWYPPSSDVLKSFIESGFSRIPVFEGELDRVIGILYNKDVYRALQEKDEFFLRPLLRPLFFVPSTLPISQLLKEMQRKRIAIAMVVNEFGEVEGLVTLEDIIEEIVGEIRDESDREERKTIEQMPDGSMIVQGSALLKDLKLHFGLPFEESPDYFTLAGLVLAKLKHIPHRGEWVEHNGYKLTVVDMEDRRIVKIKCEKLAKGPLDARPEVETAKSLLKVRVIINKYLSKTSDLRRNY